MLGLLLSSSASSTTTLVPCIRNTWLLSRYYSKSKSNRSKRSSSPLLDLLRDEIDPLSPSSRTVSLLNGDDKKKVSPSTLRTLPKANKKGGGGGGGGGGGMMMGKQRDEDVNEDSIVDTAKEERIRKYRAEYYQRRREELLARNEMNRKARQQLDKQGVYTYVERGRPRKKRADVSKDSSGPLLTPEEVQREIDRHEQLHAEWLKSLEAEKAEMANMYEKAVEDEDEDLDGVPQFDAPRDRALNIHEITELLKLLKARDVCVIDVRHKTDLCDYMVICTGTSGAHLQGMCDSLVQELRHRRQYHSMPRVEGRNNPFWVLVDTGAVMVHLFERETRAKYNLESLWVLRPSLDEFSYSQDTDWEADLFPEYAESDMGGASVDEPEETAPAPTPSRSKPNRKMRKAQARQGILMARVARQAGEKALQEFQQQTRMFDLDRD